jgi:uncharacterized GH25 family protein
MVGDGEHDASDRVLGFTLELVAERNPYRLEPGAELPVRLLYYGRPLASAWVTARHATDPDRTIRARTDEAGRVVFNLPHGGTWLIRALHVIPAAPGLENDWESLWASLTFELPG